MVLRYTNTAILALILFLTLTGLYGLVFSLKEWAFELHRWAGWALVVLVPWKAVISARSLRRGPSATFDRSIGISASLALTALILVVGGLGLMWMWRTGPVRISIFGLSDTLISWHWMIGLLLLPLFVLHSWRNWPRPKQEDFISRRGFLWTAGLATAAAIGWWGAEALAQSRALALRRWTGSREEGSFSGNSFPVTAMVKDGAERVSIEDWRLEVHGAETEPALFSYNDVLAMPRTVLTATLDCTGAEPVACETRTVLTATLDCTVGWYTTQDWSGILLADLVAQIGNASDPKIVKLQAIEGYFHIFAGSELDDLLLATHVGNEPLAHRHGFPLRAVVPSRRGWFWVKWLSSIRVVA